MALVIRKCATDFLLPAKWILRRDIRMFSSVVDNVEVKVQEKNVPVSVQKKDVEVETKKPVRKSVDNPALEFRHIYPEFLPDPNPKFRNSLREKLERADMLQRRNQVEIPEFYVGSILAVVISDPHAQGKTNRFVGICIDRLGSGLRAEFILRNVVDHQGVEVRYDLYDPTILSIQVLRLEKRLDEKLYYLRDALPEYSTFPFDMSPELLPEGSKVQINPIQVQLKPRPWLERWERQDLKGVSNIEEHLNDKIRKQRELRKTPWEKYDLMKQYRSTVPIEEQSEIWGEVYNQLHQQHIIRKKISRKRALNLPKSQDA